MPPSRREKQYAATSEEIKVVARRLMAERGTAGLSLREIARVMEMTAPALYHYFPNRDALITALIADTFNALADALEQARGTAEGAPAAEQLMAVILAYRAWALEHPTDFQLIYGNPIPSYVAPREITVPAVVRGFAVFVALLTAALARGELVPRAPYRDVPPRLAPHLAEIAARDGYAGPLLALYLGVVAWPRIHGILMLELFEHIQPVVGDIDAFFRIQMENLLEEIGMRVERRATSDERPTTNDERRA